MILLLALSIQPLLQPPMPGMNMHYNKGIERTRTRSCRTLIKGLSLLFLQLLAFLVEPY